VIGSILVAAIARIVVIADFIFTATAVVAQPITGVALAWHMGWSLWEGAGPFDPPLPCDGRVLAAGGLDQMRMRDLAAEAAATDQPLPLAYHKLLGGGLRSASRPSARSSPSSG
jgi:uncharacterized membrane protein